MTEEQLIQQGYRKYSGHEVDVFFNGDVCIHSGNCVRGNPAVFDVKRKPWVIPDNASTDEVKAVINTCPSGALQYIHKSEASNGI